MEENKIWANLNDSYNLEIILKENQDLLEYIPKKENIIPIVSKTIINDVIDQEIIVLDILKENYTILNALQILNKQNTVTAYLIKLYRSSKSDKIIWDNFRQYLLWILETSKFIATKKNMNIQLFKTDKIYRSSYTFCNKKDECESIYKMSQNNSKNCKCTRDHYVHDKIVSDLTSIIYNFDLISINISNDLRVCLETLNFVMNHMYQELNNFNIYYSKQANFNINKYYVVNNIRHI